jgi:hypothetical protein
MVSHPLHRILRVRNLTETGKRAGNQAQMNHVLILRGDLPKTVMVDVALDLHHLLVAGTTLLAISHRLGSTAVLQEAIVNEPLHVAKSHHDM